MKKIKEVNDLFELGRKYNELKDRIEKLCTYEPELIAEQLRKVMSAYEDLEYEIICDDNVFLGKKIILQAIDYNKNSVSFRLFSYDFEEKAFYDTFDEKRPLAVMFPSGYLEGSEENSSYLQDFMDYLFTERSKDDKFEVDDDYLIEKTRLYIENTKDSQLAYQNSKKELPTSEETEEDVEDFQIERRSIFRAVKYILNNYSNIRAFEEMEEENADTDRYNGLKICHSIKLYSDKIPSANKVIVYDKLITYPKDKERSEYDYVRYGDLIDCLGEDVINNCQVLDDFLYNVSELFMEEEKIPKEDVEELLSCYKVEKVKDKVLTLKNDD